ncbi:MAG: ATP-dependent RecD-like DNA helicase [Lachnospiraceae bacterium]|nr:ATP-dependent RecD-like DNA helicase [Lachnospiraceae bacterium]
MEEIRGYVEHIIYRNEENTYTVFVLNDLGDSITCVGYPVTISEGESCVIAGEYTEHPVYGQQLKVERYEPAPPEDAQAMLRYLSAGSVKGIGEALAKKIVRKFGNETLRIMEEEPERLAEIRGISERKAREIAAQMEEKRDLRAAVLFLQQYGIGNRTAMRIWKAYGMQLYGILNENPYKLAEDIDGIGFATADSIASRMGVEADSDFRIRSGLLYVLSGTAAEGNSFLPREILLQRTVDLLQVPPDPVELQLDNLAVERRVRICRKEEQVQVYSLQAFRTEQRTARLLLELDGEAPGGVTEEGTRERIARLEQEEGISLDPLQREAVTQAAAHGVLILTGGPGTGKTTTINTLIRFFEEEGLEVMLAAPTGRAAKRMSETTGRKASTIHRLLGVKAVRAAEGSDRGYGAEKESGISYSWFEKGKDDPLETDVLIIDEMSMVDMNLFYSLLQAVTPGTRLILVGDMDQLPSVGPGRVLQDLIDSDAFCTIMLRRVFRQAAESDIVMNAHRILEGEALKLDNKSRDFFFLARADVPVICKHMVELMRDRLPGYAGCTAEEIQVLTPMRKGLLGVNNLNRVLQSVLNPPGRGAREYRKGDIVFREGDKVMQTRNNYQLEWEVRGNFGMPIEKGTGVFNGDCGVIREIDVPAQTMTVCFDEDRTVVYGFSETDDLEPAYAVTVHKSQGSEYPAVILPLLSGPRSLFSRNLLYTAVTRARRCVVILGSRQTVEEMVRNTRQNTRYTGLADRIREIAGTGVDERFPLDI